MATQTNALDPQVMLATSVHAQPGVYALLLGSGVSTGSGIPTGWGVITELVRKAAAAAEPSNEAAADEAARDPEAWWAENGDGQPLGYSNLLAALGPTPAARRGILKSFFEPSEEDLEQGLKTPSAAHRSIAMLVKRGTIRVVLTTNFDRLMERALEDVGVSPQVIATPDGITGMTPLPHAPATVIKIHGDYADLQQRNTIEELETYPPEWDALLDRVFDEYGLLVSGWSADWDVALVAAHKRTRSRRYPFFWDERSSKGEAAKELLAQHRGIVVPAESADALFQGLADRLEALDRLAEPPLTTAIAVQRLKRFLPDPLRRIDLHDLVLGQTQRVVDHVAEQSVNLPGLDHPRIEQLADEYLAVTEPLLHLLTTGIQHDAEGQFTALWTESLQRLLRARGRVDGSYNAFLDRFRHYPALLALRACGIAALAADREGVLLALFSRPIWRSQFGNETALPAGVALDEYDVLGGDVVNGLPRWEGTKWTYPPSHLLRADLRESLSHVVPDDGEYKSLSDRYEFAVALFEFLKGERPMAGEFIGDWQWTNDIPRTEITFRAAMDQADEDWAWWRLLGDRDEADARLLDLRESLKKMRRWG